MGYPSSADVGNSASQLRIDPIVVYAFAAEHGRLPIDLPEAKGFQNEIAGEAQRAGVDPLFVYGFVQERGRVGSADEIHTWMSQRNFLNTSGQLTGYSPFPGQGYPPGGLASQMPAAAGAAPAPHAGGFLGQLTANPVLLVGIGVGVLLLATQGGRRR